MGKDSKIEWTDHTFNPWWGCTKVSPGCSACYAMELANRYGTAWGPTATRRMFGAKHWAEPLRWNKAAEKAGRRARVFCASMADVCEDRPELVEPRHQLATLILSTPALDWLLLTKRPENFRRLFDPLWEEPEWPENVWAGTSVENQEMADKRIPELVQVPAAVRFLSVEPLLGPVDLMLCRWFQGDPNPHPADRSKDIHHVICGGESGPHARPMHPNWARSIQKQCEGAGVPFLFKQWGEWSPKPMGTGITTRVSDDSTSTPWPMYRVGKHAAGRELDGKVYDEYPVINLPLFPRA